MNTKKMHFSAAVILSGFLWLGLSTHGFSETRKMVATGVTLNDVRVQILSTDESSGVTQVRLSGENCQYCEDVYEVDRFTQIVTANYQGPMDLELLDDMIFVRGSVRVIRADKWVQEVRYVEVNE